MNPRYLHIFLGQSMGPLNAERSRRDGSKTPLDLGKWNTSVFPYSNISPNFFKREEITL